VYSVKLPPTDGGLRSEMSDQVNVNNVNGSNIAFAGYPAWLASVGVDGAGVIIANVDGGVNGSHPDLANRMVGCTGDTCGGGASSSHGTHTAGIMAADGSSGVLDGFGFLRGLGVSPGASLVEQVYSPTFTQPGGMLKLMTESQRNGASLSGNSWGPSGSPQGYDDDTRQVDVGVRDADPALAGNQPLSFVLSFMNGNGGTSTQGTPDEAKNVFTIGSTKMQFGNGAQDSQIDDLSSNSAHGPALDGRTIPHMVAPGCEVDSTVTSGHGLMCGTSMASPHVSGAVALFVEYYRGLPDTLADPSPALVKAAFLAIARNLAGNQDADGGTLGNPFDSKQGWGRMDLEAVIDPPANSVRYFDAPVLLGSTGEEWVTSVSPLDAGSPVRIMLVWTDAPGHGLGGSTPAWNNDLDLVVEVGANTYRGNRFGANGFSITGGNADFRNNTEGVFLQSVGGGGVTIRVVAANINSDGVPSVGDATDQDFALACYNCAVEPSFTLAANPSSIAVCAPDDATTTIEVGQILGFDEPVHLSVSGTPAGATASFGSSSVVPPGSTILTVADTGLAAGGTYTLAVEGVSGSLVRSTGVDLRIDSGPPAEATLVSPPDGATGTSVAPTLTWTAVPETVSYDVEVAADPDFTSVVYSATVATASHTLATPLGTLTTYYWRVQAQNGCGTGPHSATRSFTTLDFPPVLLVDDDDNDPDVRGAHTAALDALGVLYDVWNTANTDAEPTAVDLAPYQAVIWFTGDEFGGSAGPGSAGESALGSWLGTGGCLLLASQDYHYDRGTTAFMTDYLGVASVNDDESQTQATGLGTLFGGLGPYALAYPYTNYSDIVSPTGAGEVAFSGNQGTAALAKLGGNYLTSYLTFGLEAISAQADRMDVLGAFFEGCAEMPQPDSDQDGVPNDADCASTDASLWSAPGPATGLTVKRTGLNNITWTPPAAPGSTSVVYDLLRSHIASNFDVATCRATNTSLPRGTDLTTPLPGTAYYYLVRVENGCGVNMGTDSSGNAHTGTTCP
jgi:hypothetical protein